MEKDGISDLARAGRWRRRKYRQRIAGAAARWPSDRFRRAYDVSRAHQCFDWDGAKNAKLRAERGIGFEDIVFHIERGDLLDILEHPNPDRYVGRIFVVLREDYVYLVPFVEDEHAVFLKTIIPSRKATKQYLGEGVRR